MTRGRNATNGSNPSGDLFLGTHVVCILDVLGQQSGLQRWAQLPPSGKPNAETFNAIKYTLGSILGLREMFETQFKILNTPQLPADQLESLCPATRDRFHRVRDCQLSSQQFSDTFVFYAPLHNDHGDILVTPLFRMLAACCLVFTAALSAKTPLRGAIAIGLGTEIEPGNFYGPALAEAHHLEAKVADYPRIILSEGAARFAAGNAGFSADEQVEAMTREMSEANRLLLCRAPDGPMMVDVIGPGIRHLQGAKPAAESPVHDAYRFARQELARFTKLGDKKHAQRYEKLLAYMTEKLPCWGYTPEEVADA